MGEPPWEKLHGASPRAIPHEGSPIGDPSWGIPIGDSPCAMWDSHGESPMGDPTLGFSPLPGTRPINTSKKCNSLYQFRSMLEKVWPWRTPGVVIGTNLGRLLTQTSKKH